MATNLKLTTFQRQNAANNFLISFNDKTTPQEKIAIASTISLNMPCPPEQTESMSILLGQYEFLGPYLDPADIKNLPGLLAVLVQIGTEFELVELSESIDLRQSAQSAAFIPPSVDSTFSFAVHYTDGLLTKEREQLRDEIMKEFNDDN